MCTILMWLYLVGVVINFVLFMGVMHKLFSRSWPVWKCFVFSFVWPAVWFWELIKDRLPRRYGQAGVMIVIKDGLVLSVSRRHNKNIFGLPGGKFNPNWPDKDWSTRETAIRETKEETGIVVTKCLPIYGRVEPGDGPKGVDFYSNCYYASEWHGEPRDSDEGVVKWLTVEELTSTKAAFGEYNTKAFEIFRKLFPEVELK